MKLKILTIAMFTVLLVGTFGVIPTLPLNAAVTQEFEPTLPLEIPESIMPQVEAALAADNPNLPADFDIGSVLGDRLNEYKTTYEPWKSKAAIHAIAFDEDTGFMALGGGYLYDNEVHVFRLNTETNEFDKVWDTGDGVFQSDVLSIDFGDTDLNDFIEIAAACADGHVYLFEQRHLYDPYANTENQFDLVWTSPSMFRAFTVKIDDIDRDYRPDIIAGGWDGQVHIYEYDNHSGYPFVEEHWITFDEVATLDVGDKVYSLETGDTNGNGLPEIIVGTRDGTVSVFENEGITLWVNGYPFPLIYDNHYYLNWTSENYTWTPILSMAVGELDGSLGDEIALVAQGQGIFTLDWDQPSRTYKYQKVYRSYDEWETFGFWGLDYWADSVVEAWNVTYHDPVNGSISVAEPIQYVWGGSYFIPDASVYPYNTGMATFSDGNFSTFDASDATVDNATAIIDFGLDEEGTGSANSDPDLDIKFNGIFTIGADISPYFNFSISQDGITFEQVTPDHFIYSSYYLKVDVDDALSRRQWDWFRYAKISVFNGASYGINSLELKQVYNLVTEALSVTIGPLKEDGNNWYSGGSELDKIIVGTSIGEFLGIKWDEGESIYDLFWESGDDDYYTFDANVWDIEYLGTPTNLPNWNLMAGHFMHPISGYDAHHWSWGVLSPLTDPDYNMFLASTKDGSDPQFSAHTITGAEDTDATLLLSDVNGELGQTIFDFDTVSAEVPLLQNPLYGSPLLPMFVVGGLDTDTPIESISAKYRANILFFYRDDSALPFNDFVELWQIDTDGQLSALVNLAKATPKMDFADYDDDGDLDFVVSNGRIYMAENVQDDTNYLNYTLNPGYFESINAIETASVWGQPELHDLDGDGDMDLIMSYDNKDGSTCFINEGTAEEPVWVEKKKMMSNPGELTNMKLLNLTNTRIVPDYGGYYKGLYLEWYDEVLGNEKPEYYMYSYNSEIESLYMSKPVFGAADSYMVASYPRVARLHFSLMDGDVGKFYNLGFHVMEDWNNDADLNDWTLTITSADTDNDGNGEIIIGDYDNNVYAFEHLVNNTYKRIFRSFDLNHSDVTDISPYAYEDLEGISGDFNRRIWDHAKHLVADVDLDQDGLKEIIVAANLQFYIFEEVGLTGGDAVRFVYSVDLRDTDWGDRNNFEDYAMEITAMAAGDDLDYDGRKELAVAAGPYLWIFNINLESFEAMEDNDYYVTSPVMEGRYFMVGNGDNSLFKYFQINAMTLCDTDKDGYREVIIGGVEDIQLDRQNGFVYIYECVGGTFQKTWQAPSEVTTWNPVSVILLDDQDYDGEQEIIIGHTNGFDMWEHVPGQDNTYQKVEYVTANPNYPIMPVKTTLNAAETYEMTGRSHKDVAYGYSGIWEDYAWMVYERNADPGFEDQIWLKIYLDSTDQWARIGNLGGVWTYNGNSTNIVNEYNPSICSTTDGDFLISWEAYDEGGTHYLAVGLYDVSATAWLGAELFPETTGMFWVDRFNPGVFEFNQSHIGIVYTYDASLQITDMACIIINKDLTGGFSGAQMNFNGRYYFTTHDIDAVRLADGRVAVAMSAINRDTYKPDYDVWVSVSLDNKFNFTGVSPHQATTSYLDEMYVDIDYLRTDDQSLVILYESIGEILEDKFKMSASQDDGATWGVPESLNSIPAYVTRTEYPGGFVSYSVSQPTAFSPTFCARADGGFIYSFTFAYIFHYKPGDTGWFRIVVPDPVYGKNLQSDWALNSLRDVVDLDVGDTDGDNRREVVVGFENQIGVYELESSTDGTGFMTYLEDWLSDPYEYPVTGVTVSDSNGNGWDEIALSCQRGEVFFLEFIDVSEGTVPLQGAEVNWTYAMDGYPMYGGFDSMAAYDLDSDGKEEVIVAAFDSFNVTALDEDGSVIWVNDDSTQGYRRILLADVTNDTIPEVILGGRDDVLRVLNITTGDSIWKFDGADGDIHSIEVGDITGDGLVEVIFGTSGDSVRILHHNGTSYNNWTLGLSDVYQLLLGNFTGGSDIDLALTAGTRIVVMNPTNGTVLYQSASSTTIAPAHLRSYDFDDDGLEELVYARYGIHILDVANAEIIYNSSIWDLIWDIWVEDFDGDNEIEIVGFSYYGGVYCEDIKGGILQWEYIPNSPVMWSNDAEIGHFGGSGELDIVVGYMNITDSTGGITVALDGKNGLPIWFNRTDDYPYTVFAADIHGEGLDTAFSWDRWGYGITAIDSYERIPLEVEEAFSVHQIYWDKEFANVSVSGTVVGDLNADGIDEIVVWDNDNFVHLVNGTNGQTFWSVNLTLPIKQIRIGNLDGSGWLDVVVMTGDYVLHLLNGQTGAEMNVITPTTDDKFYDFYIENFSASYSNDEIAVLVQSPGSAQVDWYDGDDGSLDYSSSTSIADTVYEMAVGDITGDGLPDVVIGGYNEFAVIYRGTDGQYHDLYDFTPYTIYGILVGNFTGDQYADIVLQDSSYDLYIIDGQTTTLITYMNFLNYPHVFAAADLDNDGKDELVTASEKVGVEGFDQFGAREWFFEAMLLVGNWDFTLTFGDMDGDSYTDVIMTNSEYIAVISGDTERLLWHYVSNERNTHPAVGHFVGAGAPLDILSYRSGRIYVVSGTNPAPTPPAAIPLATSMMSLIETIATVAGVGIPIVILLLVPALFVFRKRREEE